MGQRRLDQQEGRRQVDREIALPICEAHLLDARFLHHAGVVDQHVEAPCPAGRLRHHLGRAVRVGEVGGDCLKLGIRTALCGEDAGALVTQTAGDGLPDAAAPAGDQRDLALKPAHDTGFPPFTSTSAPHM